jgi:hypothetical protein
VGSTRTRNTNVAGTSSTVSPASTRPAVAAGPDVFEHAGRGDERREAAGLERRAVVGDELDLDDLAGLGIDVQVVGERPAEHGFSFFDGDLDGVDRVAVVARRRDVEAELVFRPVVRASREAPRRLRGGLVITEVELPDAVASPRRRHERGPTRGGELAGHDRVVHHQPKSLRRA